MNTQKNVYQKKVSKFYVFSAFFQILNDWSTKCHELIFEKNCIVHINKLSLIFDSDKMLSII